MSPSRNSAWGSWAGRPARPSLGLGRPPAAAFVLSAPGFLRANGSKAPRRLRMRMNCLRVARRAEGAEGARPAGKELKGPARMEGAVHRSLHQQTMPHMGATPASLGTSCGGLHTVRAGWTGSASRCQEVPRW
eukprot:scaffold5946_cov114-Isochrysis_galbana.AAC.11